MPESMGSSFQNECVSIQETEPTIFLPISSLNWGDKIYLEPKMIPLIPGNHHQQFSGTKSVIAFCAHFIEMITSNTSNVLSVRWKRTKAIELDFESWKSFLVLFTGTKFINVIAWCETRMVRNTKQR